MNQNKVIRFVAIYFSFILSFSLQAQDNQALLSGHRKIAILPAYYFDRTETSRFGDEGRKLKLLQQFKKEIGIDVQYKFYLPVMQQQENFSTFFRGADTINKILDSNSISFISYESRSNFIDFKRLSKLLDVDAIIVLELTEANAYSERDISNIFLSVLAPSNNLFEKVVNASTVTNTLNNQTVSLKLTAKIYDCATSELLWSRSSKVKNEYYHDAVRKMTELILKKIPYRLKKK